jgi:hypothetical protein
MHLFALDRAVPPRDRGFAATRDPGPRRRIESRRLPRWRLIPNPMDHDDSRFIAGIYNYCDRWCERCRFTDRCRVYASEQAQMERHVLRGEDPNDPEIALQDAADSLGQALQMLAQFAEERGFSLEDTPPPACPPAERADPLRERATRWTKRVSALLARMRADLPAIGQGLGALAGTFTDREEADGRQAFERLDDAHAVLCRYHVLIPAKIGRAVEMQTDAEAEADAEFAQSSRDDALGTAKIAHECLGKAAAALWSVGEFSRAWQGEALPLAAEAESLRQAIDAAFPGHQQFLRPGLDDPAL